MTGGVLLEKIAKIMNKCPDAIRMFYAGQHLISEWTLGDQNVLEGAIIDVMPVQIGGKPVVYLFPPRPLPCATVSVRLVSQWNFTHVYPLINAKTSANGKKSITWSVSADIDGTLIDKGSNTELSYLF